MILQKRTGQKEDLIFEVIRESGHVEISEMMEVFNTGPGC